MIGDVQVIWIQWESSEVWRCRSIDDLSRGFPIFGLVYTALRVTVIQFASYQRRETSFTNSPRFFQSFVGGTVSYTAFEYKAATMAHTTSGNTSKTCSVCSRHLNINLLISWFERRMNKISLFPAKIIKWTTCLGPKPVKHSGIGHESIDSIVRYSTLTHHTSCLLLIWTSKNSY